MRSGQKVGKYILGERIARGGMAEVWAARVEGPEGFVKSVALKFVVDSGDPEMDRLFVNEARLAAELQHPNLVTVFDFDRIADATDFGSPGRYYIAMERVEGHDLRQVLQVCRQKGVRFPVRLSLYVAGEVLKGLRYVHERPVGGFLRERGATSLVHRDVSPHNILLGHGGDVKLSDFGIAKVVVRDAPGVKSGLVRGKLPYASPEQARGEPVDHRSDQFSLGVTLWELLADRRLFAGATDAETLGRVLAGEVPALPTEAGIGADIEALVRRMLASDVGDRFATTAAALSALMSLREYSADGSHLGAFMNEHAPPRPALALPITQPLQPFPQAASASESGGGGARFPRAPSGPVTAPAGSTLWLDDAAVVARPSDGVSRPRAREASARVGAPPRGSSSSSSEESGERSLGSGRTPAVPVGKGPARGGRAGRIAPGATPAGPPLIDFATRAPLRQSVGFGWLGWLGWGMVAAVVGLGAWGAVLGLRHGDSLLSVSAGRRQSVRGPRAAPPARDRDGPAAVKSRPPILTDPVRTAAVREAEPAAPLAVAASGGGDGHDGGAPQAVADPTAGGASPALAAAPDEGVSARADTADEDRRRARANSDFGARPEPDEDGDGREPPGPRITTATPAGAGPFVGRAALPAPRSGRASWRAPSPNGAPIIE